MSDKITIGSLTLAGLLVYVLGLMYLVNGHVELQLLLLIGAIFVIAVINEIPRLVHGLPGFMAYLDEDPRMGDPRSYGQPESAYDDAAAKAVNGTINEMCSAGLIPVTVHPRTL